MIGIPITNRRFFPQFLRKFKQVKGVCLGECVDGCSIEEDCLRDCHNDGFDIVAHAHSSPADEYRGWICLSTQVLLFDELTILHEVAHILSPGGHDKYWRATLKNIGGTFHKHSFLNFSYPDYSHTCPIRSKR